MRNDFTDGLSDQLQRAFKRSGKSLAEFTEHLSRTRGIFNIQQDKEYVLFCVEVGHNICTFYFTSGRWFCKL